MDIGNGAVQTNNIGVGAVATTNIAPSAATQIASFSGSSYTTTATGFLLPYSASYTLSHYPTTDNPADFTHDASYSAFASSGVFYEAFAVTGPDGTFPSDWSFSPFPDFNTALYGAPAGGLSVTNSFHGTFTMFGIASNGTDDRVRDRGPDHANAGRREPEFFGSIGHAE